LFGKAVLFSLVKSFNGSPVISSTNNGAKGDEEDISEFVLFLSVNSWVFGAKKVMNNG